MKYRRADHVAWRQIDAEMVLVDLAAKEMLGLNASGGALWDLLEHPVDAEQLARATAETSGGTVSAAEVEAFLDQLVMSGLLVASTGPQEVVSPPDGSRPVPTLSTVPLVLWRERVRQAAGTCAFLPGSGPLCNQAPFS